MNILYHHRTRGKGAEGAHIKGIVMAFRKLGHKVTLSSIHNVDPTKPIDNSTKQAVSPQPKKSIKHRVLELTKYMPEFVFEMLEVLYNLIALRQIKNEIKIEEPTFIYERYSLFMFATVWYAKKYNIPMILEVNDSALVERVRHLLFKKLACKIEQWTFQNATGLVFISSYFQKLAQDNYQNIAPSVVSPNAADTDVFDPTKYPIEEAKANFGLTGKTVCGFAGAFHHWHGIDWFVEEVISELKNHPDLVLFLVGDGPRHQFIKELAETHNITQQILMPGRIEHTEIPKAVAAMDFGIIPDSNDYGSPMKLFEFMAMGKGMIVPDFTPITEVVTNNSNSWLFERKNKQDCVKRFFEIASDTEQLKKVGENAIEYIENKRQWRHNVEQIITLAQQE
ncbi:MAG: glycosyltransferase family 4 protein [Colwellia sp.]|nr:glycosyltransferase family 4 protein [Colwellia sp.]